MVAEERRKAGNLPQPPMPPGWEEREEPDSERRFYAHPASGVTQWERPAIGDPPPTPRVAPPPKATTVPLAATTEPESPTTAITGAAAEVPMPAAPSSEPGETSGPSGGSETGPGGVGVPGAAVSEAGLPGWIEELGWEARVDEASGRGYYAHRPRGSPRGRCQLKQSSRRRASGLESQKKRGEVQEAPLPAGWEESGASIAEAVLCPSSIRADAVGEASAPARRCACRDTNNDGSHSPHMTPTGACHGASGNCSRAWLGSEGRRGLGEGLLRPSGLGAYQLGTPSEALLAEAQARAS